MKLNPESNKQTLQTMAFMAVIVFVVWALGITTHESLAQTPRNIVSWNTNFATYDTNGVLSPKLGARITNAFIINNGQQGAPSLTVSNGSLAIPTNGVLKVQQVNGNHVVIEDSNQPDTSTPFWVIENVAGLLKFNSADRDAGGGISNKSAVFTMASTQVGANQQFLASGGFGLLPVFKTTNYTGTANESFLLYNCNSGALTNTLPSATNNVGATVYIAKLDLSNLLWIIPNGSETIRIPYAPFFTNKVFLGSATNNAVQLLSTGTNWISFGDTRF